MTTNDNEIKPKTSQQYSCEICHYYTSKISNFNNHIKTNKHLSNINNNEIKLKTGQKYSCENCDYYTSKISNYNNHLKTNKHINNTNKSYLTLSPKYSCENCHKYFNDRAGLWRHKQKCINIKEDKILVENIIAQDKKNDKMINVVLELVKQNTEFKDLLAEQHKYIVQQNKQIVEQNKQNYNLQSQFIELAKEKTISNCNNITTNNNNTHFNLQFFLNETCKDAMNITDFIEQINVSLTDLENTGRLGYAEGITRIFVKGLKELDINQRPIHCSDGKRETLYIKDGNVWEKDDINKSKLTNAIKKVAHKNIRKINDWVNVHPNCKDSESNKNDLYLRIVSNSMSGCTDDEAENNYNKIKRNIIKEVIIDK
jgi:hypothetical protein